MSMTCTYFISGASKQGRLATFNPEDRDMSIESAKAFVKRMNDDEEFRTRIMAIEDDEARMAAVNDEGFDFSLDELMEQEGFSVQGAGLVFGGFD